jgi:prepilin-type N-terminal cleavage/methylation domain-containing protein
MQGSVIYMKKMINSKRGFTLTEIVVVITVVVILSSVSIVGIASTIEKAKNAQEGVQKHNEFELVAWQEVKDIGKGLVGYYEPPTYDPNIEEAINQEWQEKIDEWIEAGYDPSDIIIEEDDNGNITNAKLKDGATPKTSNSGSSGGASTGTSSDTDTDTNTNTNTNTNTDTNTNTNTNTDTNTNTNTNTNTDTNPNSNSGGSGFSSGGSTTNTNYNTAISSGDKKTITVDSTKKIKSITINWNCPNPNDYAQIVITYNNSNGGNYDNCNNYVQTDWGNTSTKTTVITPDSKVVGCNGINITGNYGNCTVESYTIEYE